jgi:hypothetical protein
MQTDQSRADIGYQAFREIFGFPGSMSTCTTLAQLFAVADWASQAHVVLCVVDGANARCRGDRSFALGTDYLGYRVVRSVALTSQRRRTRFRCERIAIRSDPRCLWMMRLTRH